jgi:hypothetical protein
MSHAAASVDALLDLATLARDLLAEAVVSSGRGEPAARGELLTERANEILSLLGENPAWLKRLDFDQAVVVRDLMRASAITASASVQQATREAYELGWRPPSPPKCRRCGRVLTDDVSIAKGLGPECERRELQGAWGGRP